MLLLKTKLHSKESTEENVTGVGKTSMEAKCVVENNGTNKEVLPVKKSYTEKEPQVLINQ